MSNTTPSREVVSVVPMVQQTHADCVVAAVAMLLGVPYSEVFQTRAETVKKIRKHGAMSTTSIQRLGKAMGAKLTKQKDVDLDEDTGILVVDNIKDGLGHAVVLFRGVIVDPTNGQLWSPEAYFNPNPQYVVECLLVLA
jgi:hypothetical protein